VQCFHVARVVFGLGLSFTSEGCNLVQEARVLDLESTVRLLNSTLMRFLDLGSFAVKLCLSDGQILLSYPLFHLGDSLFIFEVVLKLGFNLGL